MIAEASRRQSCHVAFITAPLFIVFSREMSNLTVQLALSLALRLRLAGKGEVGEVELGTLCVRSEQLRFLGVQEGEGLGARPVSLHTHL